ncbi:MAG: hypothetical protein ACKO7W_09310 [Elainella sp.]
MLICDANLQGVNLPEVYLDRPDRGAVREARLNGANLARANCGPQT